MNRQNNYQIELQILQEGYDRKMGWFQSRAAFIPPETALITVTKNSLSGSDVFCGIYFMLSKDSGKTFSPPQLIPHLIPKPLEKGFTLMVADLAPLWHNQTKRLLLFGSTVVYTPEMQVSVDKSYRRDVCYVVYNPASNTFSDWHILDLPDKEHFFRASAGCVQAVAEENGDILLPICAMSKDEVGSNFWKGHFITTVIRAKFDGKHLLTFIEQGEELTVPEPRGLYEPSLIRFKNKYFLTMRNDLCGYVAVSDDGLHYETLQKWAFDDGTDLGSYNTQQHWVSNADSLFLVYTRRGANNDDIFRHRAPLFMGQVDLKTMRVIKDSEVEVIPNKGAQLGNFGAYDVSEMESWIITSECMQGSAKNPYDLSFAEKRGANNRIYLAHIYWK